MCDWLSVMVIRHVGAVASYGLVEYAGSHAQAAVRSTVSSEGGPAHGELAGVPSIIPAPARRLPR